MPLTLVLAYRNLFRNTRRTVLTSLMIGCCLAALILTDGVIKGMLDVMIDSVTQTFAGEGQVHRKGFRDSLDTDLYMNNIDELEATLKADKSIAGYSVRTIAGGMISSSYHMTGGAIYGVSAEQEAGVSKLKQAIIQGSYLSDGDAEILIGKGMAELLEVDLGDRLVVTLAQVDGGDLSQALFRVSGIFQFGMRELDENVTFISLARGRELLGTGQGAHEIAIRFVNAEDAEDSNLPIFKQLSRNGNEALGWLEINPQIGAMIEMVDYSTLIVGLVLYLLAALGIINSMFMSIYERIYEFGVIKALGTRPGQLIQLILIEALLLGILGSIIGLALGGALTWYFSVHGIPLGEFEFEGISLADKIRTIPAVNQFVVFPIWVLVLTVVAGIYPAIFASRIVPSRALQRAL
ncbi:MAG: ABC transporter permease [Gammaproteobacteria bacterium]|nr:ABC transporter permease [Gammaproteobacteria bacterium]